VGRGELARHRGRAPLIPADRRRLVVSGVLLGVLVVGVLAVRYTGDGAAGRLDRTLAALVPMHDGHLLTPVEEALADLGDPIPVVVLMLVLAAAGWWWRRWRGLAVALVAPGAAMVTTSLVLKPIVGRTRDASLAFPSGHTTAVASIAATAVLLVLGTPALSRRVRRLTTAGLALLVVAVGVCLVGRGYHYPTDVLGGLGVVVGVVPPAALVVDAFADLSHDDGSGGPTGTPTERLPAAR
jgi:hypothetical protein